MEPDYEPARIFLECCIVQKEVEKERDFINNIKVSMADLIAEYDRKKIVGIMQDVKEVLFFCFSLIRN